ncbi:MAG: GLPGLI family protein [Urechidicola sp.]|nr:GLPGLI family protein [Urechidicola sp.]
MEKLLLKLIALSLILISISVSAQDFQGQAYYQTQRKVDMKMDNAQMTDEQQSQMQAMLKKQFERTYILTFNKEASMYKEEEQLDKPTDANQGGLKVMVLGGGAGTKLYKNTKTKTYADEQDVFGKSFLVKDDLETYDWVLGDESKIIGKYLCFKATATREVESMSMSFGNAVDEEDSKDPKTTTVTQIVTAWYTPDIPVSDGPDNYWGLPGLILELHDGEDMSYLCTKILMNSKDKAEIEAPTKGKVVTNKEYEEIMQKKMQEMQEMYGGRERKGEGGKTFNIQIGG